MALLPLGIVSVIACFQVDSLSGLHGCGAFPLESNTKTVPEKRYLYLSITCELRGFWVREKCKKF